MVDDALRDSMRALQSEVEALRAENGALRGELNDLNAMYETTMAHGVAIEDELAEKNLELEKVQRRLVAELREGANYVTSSIPPPQSKHPRTNWKFIPSSELGGDSLGYHWIDDGHFAIYLLDVCGHGIGAALLSLSVINALRMQSLPAVDFRDPGSVLTGMNDSFPMGSHNEMFFTLWYGVFEPVGRTLRYSGGGHPPAVLISRAEGGRAEEVVLRSNQLVVGAIPGVRYATQSSGVPEACSLFVFSDGVYELQRKQGGGLLSHEDFIALLARSFAGESFGLDALLGTLREMQGSDLFQDDLSILQIDF